MPFFSHLTSLRQTFLGPSAQNELVILNLPTPISAEKSDHGESKEAFIFRLPDELLTSILEIATSYDLNGQYRTCGQPGNHSPMKKLALVCRRFHQIITPFLYRIIGLGYPLSAAPPSRQIVRFHHTLEKNPSLRQHCRILSIHITDLSSRPSQADDLSIVNDLASWLTKTRCIQIHGGFARHGKNMWAFIQNVVQHMRELEHIHISRESWGLLLPDIMAHIDLPSLAILDIQGITESMSKNNLLMLKTARTASFTTLLLSDYEESPEATNKLIQWPKILTHFTFGSFYNNRFYMDLNMFHSMLQIHKDTLVYISIGYLSGSSHGVLFNACDFPSLEVLNLSRWSMKNLDTPASDADVLLPPNLKTFGWDFSIYDQHSENWTDFGDKEENWVRGLAKAAIEKKIGLKKIKITFTPDSFDIAIDDGYPWDRMDRIHDEIRSHGMMIEYNQPSVTKELWLKIFEPRDETEENTVESVDPGLNYLDLVDLDLDDSGSDVLDFVFPDLYAPQTTFQGRDIREYF